MSAVRAPGFDDTLLSRIEDASLNASAPRQQRWVDGWLLRYSPGKSKRARSINPVADGLQTTEARLAACTAVLAEAGLPLIVRITPFSRPLGLDALLASRGLRRIDDTVVMMLPVIPVIPAEAPGTAAPTTLHPLGAAAFAECIGAFRGSPAAQRAAQRDRMMQAPVPFFAYEQRVDDKVVGCGQFALEGDLVGLYDVFTDPAERGRGHATTLCRRLLAQAHRMGGRLAYLQVDHGNEAALAVYRRLGFVEGYRYHYRTAEPGPD